MFKSFLILIIVTIISGATAISQQLSQQVLVPAAGIAVKSGIHYSQTVGEAMVDLIASTDYVLTEGFQQPGMKFFPTNVPRGGGVNVYPNPVGNTLNIVLFGETPRSFIISIINISGTVVYSYEKCFRNQFFDMREVPVNQLPIGLYFVRIISIDGVINRIFKIEKI
jgi:hypothetical protein